MAKDRVQIDLSEGELATQVRTLERKARVLEAGLRMMITAGSVGDDFLGEAYRKAGGGYEGLQAVATATLKTVEEMG